MAELAFGSHQIDLEGQGVTHGGAGVTPPSYIPFPWNTYDIETPRCPRAVLAHTARVSDLQAMFWHP